MIKFSNVSKSFNVNNQIVHAVKNVSLEISEGEIFGIIGYSGAGKSTLLRLINMLEKHDNGSIEINNNDITHYNKKQTLNLRRNIGMIFQHFNLLWSRNVYQNIALPLEILNYSKADIDNHVNELIKLVGLEGKENSYPSTLSGGQKQRVAIARALANNPKILLCDEATSALDPKTTDSIISLLKEINRKLNITIVLITHQMEVVEKLCHSIAIMVDGEIVEFGNTEQIFKNPSHTSTKHFIQTRDQIVDEENLEKKLLEVYPNGKILRLTFDKENTDQTILYNCAIQTKVAISVIHASINSTLNSAIGVMYIHTTNDDYLSLETALLKNKVKVEVISC